MHVLESTFGHICGEFCVIEDDQTGEIMGGLPVYTVKSWLLGNRLVSVPFAALCDPLVSSTEDIACLLPHVVDLGNRTSARYIEIRTLKSTALVREPRLRASHSYIHHFVRLNRSRKEIRASFGRTSVRQMIAKAEKQGFELGEGNDLSDVVVFYRLLCQTRRRLSLPPIPYRFFRNLWDTLAPLGRVVLLMARHRGATAGAVMALKWKGTFALEYVGDDERYRKSGTIQFLYWEAMKRAIDEGYGVFSFGRTYRSNKGLVESKTHWGTTAEDLCTFFYPETTHKDAEDREASWQYKLIKRLSRTLPDPGLRLLGEFCYRHMG